MGAEQSVEGAGAPMTPLDEHPSPLYRNTAQPWDPFLSEEQEYITYANDDYGFSLDYPATWAEKEEVDTEEQFKVSFSAGKYGTILVEVRNILEATGGKPATLKAWRKFNMAQFHEDKNVTILKEDSNAYLGPLPAFELLLETRTKKSVSKNRILSCVNASGSLAYAVTVASDMKLWGTFLPMFNGSLNSFSMDHRALDPHLFDEDYEEEEDEPEPAEPQKKPNKSGKNARFAEAQAERKSRSSLAAPSDQVQFQSRKSIGMVSDGVAFDESSIPNAPRNKSSELQQRAQYRRSYASGKNWYIYYNDEYHFRCEYSPTWDKKVSGNSVTFSAGDDSFATIVVEVKNIPAGNKGKPMSLAGWRAFNLKKFSSSRSVEIVEQSDDVNLSLLPGFDLVLLVKTRDYLVKNKVRSAVSPDGKLAYIVTMATRSEWFPEFRPVIEKFLYNFYIDLVPDGAAGVPESERQQMHQHNNHSVAPIDEPNTDRRPPRLGGSGPGLAGGIGAAIGGGGGGPASAAGNAPDKADKSVKRRSPPKNAMADAAKEASARAASRVNSRIVDMDKGSGGGKSRRDSGLKLGAAASGKSAGPAGTSGAPSSSAPIPASAASGSDKHESGSRRGDEKREERRNMRSRRRIQKGDGAKDAGDDAGPSAAPSGPPPSAPPAAAPAAAPDTHNLPRGPPLGSGHVPPSSSDRSRVPPAGAPGGPRVQYRGRGRGSGVSGAAPGRGGGGPRRGPPPGNVYQGVMTGPPRRPMRGRGPPSRMRGGPPSGRGGSGRPSRGPPGPH